MKNKPSDIDNDLDKAIEEGGERILVSHFPIKDDGQLVSISACKSDKEVKGVS